jgi:hypothetical protein
MFRVIGWKLFTNLSLLNVSVAMSFYIVIIMTMCYMQKMFDDRPFSYTYNIAKVENTTCISESFQRTWNTSLLTNVKMNKSYSILSID